MGLDVIQLLCPKTKHSTKCPYSMNAEYITIHNTANDASAFNEVTYMIGNAKSVSFHFAVDDTQAVQGIPLDRNSWHAGDGDGTGNRKSISIEICYSKSGGERFMQAENNAAYLTAALLEERGWGIDRVKKHQDWADKFCPHRTITLGWQRFLDMVQTYLNGETVTVQEEPKQETSNKESTVVNITYAVKLDDGRILPEVTNLNDYAGIENRKIVGIVAKVDHGHLKYQVHTLGGGWLPYVDGYDWNEPKNGYAGNGKVIDAVRMYYDTPLELVQSGGWRKVKYRVSPIGTGEYYGYQLDDEKTNGMDGYAGVFGKPIDKLQAIIEV